MNADLRYQTLETTHLRKNLCLNNWNPKNHRRNRSWPSRLYWRYWTDAKQNFFKWLATNGKRRGNRMYRKTVRETTLVSYGTQRCTGPFRKQRARCRDNTLLRRDFNTTVKTLRGHFSWLFSNRKTFDERKGFTTSGLFCNGGRVVAKGDDSVRLSVITSAARYLRRRANETRRYQQILGVRENLIIFV